MTQERNIYVFCTLLDSVSDIQGFFPDVILRDITRYLHFITLFASILPFHYSVCIYLTISLLCLHLSYHFITLFGSILSVYFDLHSLILVCTSFIVIITLFCEYIFIFIIFILCIYLFIIFLFLLSTLLSDLGLICIFGDQITNGAKCRCESTQDRCIHIQSCMPLRDGDTLNYHLPLTELPLPQTVFL